MGHAPLGPCTAPRLLAAALLLAALPCHPWAEVLVYRGDNKWVAPADNKPLVALQKQARGGKTHFSVKLPADRRALAIARLEVLRDILAREAKGAIVMEEVGTAKAGTLVVE